MKKESHLKNRPKKMIYSVGKIESLRNKTILKIKKKLLPDRRIIKIILIGSSVKESFGKYDKPGFRGSLYSDFDFIVHVDDDYKIPEWLKKEPDGKPFLDDNMNLAFRNKKFIENKYDVEIFFIYESNLMDLKIQKEGENAGIVMSKKSKHKHLDVYIRED